MFYLFRDRQMFYQYGDLQVEEGGVSGEEWLREALAQTGETEQSETEADSQPTIFRAR